MGLMADLGRGPVGVPPPIPRMPRITQLSRFNTMGVRLSTCTIRIAPTAVSRSRLRKSERAAQVKGKWGGVDSCRRSSSS